MGTDDTTMDDEIPVMLLDTVETMNVHGEKPTERYLLCLDCDWGTHSTGDEKNECVLTINDKLDGVEAPTVEEFIRAQAADRYCQQTATNVNTPGSAFT